jgi:hypothetical protein
MHVAGQEDMRRIDQYMVEMRTIVLLKNAGARVAEEKC